MKFLRKMILKSYKKNFKKIQIGVLKFDVATLKMRFVVGKGYYRFVIRLICIVKTD